MVIGPWAPFLWSPETEEVGDSPRSPRGFDLNGVMDWETPEARVNCSRSSTLVRPLAGLGIVRDVLRNKEFYLSRKHESKATCDDFFRVLLGLLFKTKSNIKGC